MGTSTYMVHRHICRQNTHTHKISIKAIFKIKVEVVGILGSYLACAVRKQYNLAFSSEALLSYNLVLSNMTTKRKRVKKSKVMFDSLVNDVTNIQTCGQACV